MFRSFFPSPRLFFPAAVLWTAIAMLLWHAHGAPEDAAADLWRRIVDATLMLATTATTWWFGSRPMRLEGK